ncbi:hypothetical protein NPIL_34421 [Nephila pilipes]|uniref:Uncharacterized protein n=1 Tax=Nephila pilipes TaxID=299642 RepID=A0A8X6TCK8_NEPPI|nr:hypothetical protein NPIL_34421 [Nephila pilipes]
MSSPCDNISDHSKILCSEAKTEYHACSAAASSQSSLPHQNQDQRFSFEDLQESESESKSSCFTNTPQNSAYLKEMHGKLNQNTFDSETPRSTDSKSPNYATFATPYDLSCITELLRSSFFALNSDLSSQNKETFISTTSTNQILDEIPKTNVLPSESLPDLAPVIGPDLSENTFKAPIDVDFPDAQFEAREKRNTSLLLDHTTAIPEIRSSFRENPVKHETTLSQLDFQSNESYKPNPSPKVQTQISFPRGTGSFGTSNNFQRFPTYGIGSPHPNFIPPRHQTPRTLTPQEETEIRRISGAHPEFGFEQGITRPDGQAAEPVVSHSATSFGAIRSGIPYQDHSNVLIRQYLLKAPYTKALNTARSHGSVTNNHYKGPYYRRGGTAVSHQYNLPRYARSYASGASYSSPYYHGTNRHESKIPEGLPPYKIRQQGTEIAGGGLPMNQLNALPDPSYSSVLPNYVNSFGPNIIRGRILETEKNVLKRSFIPYLDVESFEEICREKIVCEDDGYFFILSKINSGHISKRNHQFQIWYITSQNLDGTFNFSPNGVPRRGLKRDCTLRSKEEIIKEWLESLT